MIAQSVVGFFHTDLGVRDMRSAVKKTISLPPELAREAEETARAQGKTISGVIQDALRLARRERIKLELVDVQDYWSGKALERGILTEEDLQRYLDE
jgi:hypothetical protein